jgi:hypothetical protein
MSGNAKSEMEHYGGLFESEYNHLSPRYKSDYFNTSNHHVQEKNSIELKPFYISKTAYNKSRTADMRKYIKTTGPMYIQKVHDQYAKETVDMKHNKNYDKRIAVKQEWRDRQISDINKIINGNKNELKNFDKDYVNKKAEKHAYYSQLSDMDKEHYVQNEMYNKPIEEIKKQYG